MNLSRRTWALSALALTLLLGACSAPDDITTPTLEPQFGTDQSDVGGDVTVASNGSVVVLAGETGDGYFEEYNSGNQVYTNYERLLWNRYDKNGNLIGSSELASYNCATEDAYYEGCYMKLTPKAVLNGTNGYTYALAMFSFSALYDYGDEYVSSDYTDYDIHRIDAAGKVVRSFDVGRYTGGAGGPAVDAAVDTSGNIYVAKVEAAKNVIAKYSNTGSLLWQRISTVGTPASIAVSSSGSIYVGGSTGVAKYTNSGNLSWTKSGAANDLAVVGTNTVYARYNTTVRKLDANGKQLWSKAQSGLSGMVVGDMTTDGGANVYLTGKYSASSSNRDVFTRKLSASSGSTLFTKTFGTSAYDDARGVTTVSGSEIYLTGATQGSLAHPFQGGENDGYVRKLNSSGSPMWTR